MVIGITGPIGCGKDSVIKMIKDLAMEKYIYLNTDKIILSLLTPNTPCYNCVKEILGEERLSKYDTPNDLRKIFQNHQILYNPKDYKDFISATQPFVSCSIAKLTIKFPDKLIFIISNNLYDYDWYEKCDRVVYINTPSENRRKRLINKKFFGTNNYKNFENMFISPKEQKERADIILNAPKKEVLKKELKKMLKDLVIFKKFADKGMVPLPAEDIRKRDAEILQKRAREKEENDIAKSSKEEIKEIKPKKRRGRPPKQKVKESFSP